jgi:3-hydroxybutyryl-CoA dehydrogenase
MQNEITSVGIVGSGMMATGLAEVAARAGFKVVVKARTQRGADGVVAAVAAGFDKAIAKRKATDDQRAGTLARITATDRLGDLADCDLVIESVVEDLDVKRALFAELDAAVKAGAILASNTSTLPVVDLAMATRRPNMVCGIHFFNPATLMPLVEVVRPLTAADGTIAAALEFARHCGKDAVEVSDRAGFIVNALLFPYLNNAVRMWEHGTASMESIDVAMKGGCGFPMGPFALLDLVGLDTSLAILDALHAEFGSSDTVAAPTLRRLVAAGRLGRKTKVGFYDY